MTCSRTGDFARLQACALNREMSRQISGNGNKDVPALIAVAPLAALVHARLEHLVGIEAGILRKQHLRESCD